MAFKSKVKICLRCQKPFQTDPHHRFFCKKCADKPWDDDIEEYPVHIDESLFPFHPEDELPISGPGIVEPYSHHVQRLLEIERKKLQRNKAKKEKKQKEKKKKLNFDLLDISF